MKKNSRNLIGICGPSGSGKTTIAKKIANSIFDVFGKTVSVISEDWYYKDKSDTTQEQKRFLNYDEPRSLDHILLESDIKKLLNGHEILAPTYDYATHKRKDNQKKIPTSDIVILDGIFSFSVEKLRSLMTCKIYIDLPLDLCIVRRIKRDTLERNIDIEYVIEQYFESVRPMYFKFIEPTKQFADVIITGPDKMDDLLGILKMISE